MKLKKNMDSFTYSTILPFLSQPELQSGWEFFLERDARPNFNE